jgi:hypothetical protein
MSCTKKTILLLLWLVVATHAYAYIWSTHLDLFPQLPEKLGRWIAELTGTAESEDIEQLTLYYIFIVSFVVVTVATSIGVIALWTFRRGRKLC